MTSASGCVGRDRGLDNAEWSTPAAANVMHPLSSLHTQSGALVGALWAKC